MRGLTYLMWACALLAVTAGVWMLLPVGEPGAGTAPEPSALTPLTPAQAALASASALRDQPFVSQAFSAREPIVDVAEPPQPSASAPPDIPVMEAAALMRAYRDSGGSIGAQWQGQRLRILGQLAALEQAPGGGWLITLDAGDEGGAPVRLVVPPDQFIDADRWVAGQAVSADCTLRGTLMGEPILSDCRPSVP